MRTRYILPLMLLALCMLSSCSGGWIQLANFHKNVVIEQDGRIIVDNDYLALSDLRQELIRKLITEKSPIIVHVHYKLPRQEFETIISKLRAEGFNNLSFRRYKRR
ncbi:MAG: hypothetical protein KAH23_04440 [Kiritimatiellae bacterium]|nr:hypothetical protein [Kiritimatiellia bacterium]